MAFVRFGCIALHLHWWSFVLAFVLILYYIPLKL